MWTCYHLNYDHDCLVIMIRLTHKLCVPGLHIAVRHYQIKWILCTLFKNAKGKLICIICMTISCAKNHLACTLYLGSWWIWIVSCIIVYCNLYYCELYPVLLCVVSCTITMLIWPFKWFVLSLNGQNLAPAVLFRLILHQPFGESLILITSW